MPTTAPSPQVSEASATSRSRWLALYVLCLGDLMIVLDQSIVNVALPSIRTDLGFSQAVVPRCRPLRPGARWRECVLCGAGPDHGAVQRAR